VSSLLKVLPSQKPGKAKPNKEKKLVLKDKEDKTTQNYELLYFEYFAI
jgi:hypothetical protein